MRSRPPFLVALVTLTASLAAGAEAQAATVTSHCADPDTCALGFKAAPGEANGLTMTLVPRGHARGTLRFADAGAPVTAGAGCRQLSAHRAACSFFSSTADATVLLGGGGDRATLHVPANDSLLGVTVDGGPGADDIDGSAAEVPTFLRGGSGRDVLRAGRRGGTLDGQGSADRLTGGPGRDFISGGNGADRLAGRGGADRIEGGGGNDALAGGRGADLLDGDVNTRQGRDVPYNDVIDGGPGRDTVKYTDHSEAITLDLAKGLVVAADGEHDRLRHVENAAGTVWADTLRGDGAANVLTGSRNLGKVVRGDTLIGRGGADRLEGTALKDTLRGGGGNDLLVPVRATVPRPSRPDDVGCGPGADVVRPAPSGRLAAPLLAASCERVELREAQAPAGQAPVFDVVSLGLPRTTAAGVTIDARFSGPTRKGGRLELFGRDGTAFGTASWTAASPNHLTLSFALTAAGRAAADAHRVAVVHAVPFVSAAGDGTVTGDWAVTL